MGRVVPILVRPLLSHSCLSLSLIAKLSLVTILSTKLSLVTILSTKLTMETDWSWLRLGVRLFTLGFPLGFSLGFSLASSLGFSLGWFGLDANLSLGVDCGGTGTFPNFSFLSPLLSPNLSDPKAQPSKCL
jgi:hypothetical protein